MTFEITVRQKPGRKSIVATHPQREMIEAACAANVSLSRVARRFGIGLMAVHRHWHSLPADYRAALAFDVTLQDDLRWREVSAGLAAIARNHPETRANIAELTGHIWSPSPSIAAGERAHAA
jgi:AcrR family transcriptional regulator